MNYKNIKMTEGKGPHYEASVIINGVVIIVQRAVGNRFDKDMLLLLGRKQRDAFQSVVDHNDPASAKDNTFYGIPIIWTECDDMVKLVVSVHQRYEQ